MKIEELEARIDQASGDYEHNKYIFDRIILGLFSTFFISVILLFISNVDIIISIPIGLVLCLVIYKVFTKKYTDILLGHQNYIQGLFTIKISLIQGNKLPKKVGTAYEKFINQYNAITGQKTTLNMKRLEDILIEEGIDLIEWATRR